MICIARFVIVITGILGVGALYAESVRCGFTGRFLGIRVNRKNSSCALERAGSAPYLLISIRAGGGWLIDLSGIQNEGAADLRVKAMGPGGFGGPKSLTYVAKAKSRVLRHPKKAEIRAVKLKLVAKTADGSKGQPIEGLFAWTVSSDPEKIEGTLKLNAGSGALSTKKATISKWGSGYRISQLFLVRSGETMTLMLEVPSLSPGEYGEGQKTGARLMHMSMQAGKFSSKVYSAKWSKLRVSGLGRAVVVQFQADVSEPSFEGTGGP